MCLIKIELSKITYSFQILFKLGLNLLIFCRFPMQPRRLKDVPNQKGLIILATAPPSCGQDDQTPPSWQISGFPMR